MSEKVEIQKICSLTSTQEGMFFQWLMHTDTQLFLSQLSFRVSGELRIDLFEQSFNILIERHEVIRSIFRYQNLEQPLQVFLKKRVAKIDYRDISTVANAEQTKLINNFISEDREKSFDITKNILMRITIWQLDQSSYQIIWSWHHIIMDGWSMPILMREFTEIYRSLKNNQTLNPERVYPYSDYLKWLEKQDKEAAASYWKGYLDGYQQLALLPNRLTDERSSGQKEFLFELPENATQKLKEIASQNSVTLSTVFQSIWGILLQNYNWTNDVVFGMVTSGRPPELPGVEKMVGLFINTIPVRIKSKKGQLFTGLLRQVQDQAVISEQYSYYSLAEIQAETELKEKLIDSVIVFENYPIENELLAQNQDNDLGFRLHEFQSIEQTFYHLDILITASSNIAVTLKYNAAVYHLTTIERVAAEIRNMVEQVCKNPAISIAELYQNQGSIRGHQIIPALEFELFPCEPETAIGARFESQVGKYPDRIAIKMGNESYTYEELNRQANRIGRAILETETETETVGLVFGHGPEMAAAMLGALKVGKIYIPLDPAYPESQLNYMLENAGIGTIITHQKYLKKAVELSSSQQRRIINIDELDPVLSGENIPKLVNPEQPAYIMYTSGSTGLPKGVIQSHRNILKLLGSYTNLLRLNQRDRIALFTSYSHTVGVIDILSAILNGATLYPYDLKSEGSMEGLCQWIVKEEITVYHSVPTVYRYWLDNIEAGARFPKPRLIILGGEALHPKDLELYRRHFEDQCLLVNLFGSSEVVIATAYIMDKQAELKRATVPVGYFIDGVTAAILDSDGAEAGIYGTGEIVYQSKYLALGYWKMPEQTGAVFGETGDGKRLYRSGDLGRFLPDGSLEFIGRRDSQVKIRGYRIELAGIEQILDTCTGIQKSIVTVWRGDGDENQIVAYYQTVGGIQIDVEELRAELAAKVPDYMIPDYYIYLNQLPMTANGKIDRKALPQPDQSNRNQREYEAPRDETERKLAQIWQELLGVQRIGVNDHFFELGGHSLKATSLVARIHKHFNVEVPLPEVFKTPTIKGLSAYLAHAQQNIYSAIQPVAPREYYPLSSAQKRMYILNQIEGSGTSYNTPGATLVEGKLEKETLTKIFQKLIERHETLRTSFEMIGGEPVQKIHPRVEFEIEVVDSFEGEDSNPRFRRAPSIPDIIRNFIRPFDLSQAPLLRVGLIRLNEAKHILLYDMHHIISDGTSMGILVKEFIDLYNGQELSALRIQYKDFSEWQNEQFTRESLRKQKEYWLNQFSGEIPVLALPTDYPRPSLQSFEGERIDFEIDAGQTQGLRSVAKETGTTLFMVLLAVYNVILSKYTSQEDIIIGSPIAGRPHADLENIIGMFVNTLALRNYPQGKKSFTEFLLEVKQSSLKAYENQDYQFEELVDLLNLRRDLSRNPLFDVMFVLQNMDVKVLEIKDLRFSPYEFQSQTAKFDLWFGAAEANDTIVFTLEYCARLFKNETMVRMVNHLKRAIGQIINQPGIKLGEIELITEAEKKQILGQFNNTDAEYPTTVTIASLFEKQAMKNPDQVAVVFEDQQLTYRELNEKANQLAGYLNQERNVRPDSLVGILMERSLEMIIALYGVLKAGGAYVPMDPDSPEERIKGIINDTGLSTVISNKKYLKTLNRLQWECKRFEAYICLDCLNIDQAEETEQNQLMSKELWDYVGNNSPDEIAGGGWVSSYTGHDFSREEMEEYADNTFQKLKPYLRERTRILEIGCASGITMFKIAPYVKLYYGTDLSESMLNRNQQRIGQEGINNIQLACLAADQIDAIAGYKFDLIIINSVVQYFPGHHYLRKVIAKALKLLDDKGILFIGDVMDQELKPALLESLHEFKKSHITQGYRTKTDYAAELFVAKGYFYDLRCDYPEIGQISITNKIHTIENELTRYRYDVILEIDKAHRKEVRGQKHKQQHDLRILDKYLNTIPGIQPDPDNLAYCIHTSGSTGKPKGVMIEHAGVVNILTSLQALYPLQEADTYLLKTTYTFDVSVAELFGWFLGGGRLAILKPEAEKDPKEIVNAINKWNVTHINFVPSMLGIFLEILDEEETNKLNKLKYVFVAGEALPVSVVKQFYNRTGKVKLDNIYGPTETTIYATKYPLERDIDKQTIPIGKLLPNIKAYITDQNTRLQPVGVIGELYIAGDGLARGYLNNPELTAEKFVPNPFHVETAPPQEGMHATSLHETSLHRMYKTGDLARWLPDGNIEFFGRKDNQVKVRGNRIELGEIESGLLEHESIKEAVVIAKDDERESKYLCAYYVADQELTVTELREYLGAKLPDYMIPSYFTRLDKLPLTLSGKLDRKALPEPGGVILTGAFYLAPQTETEARLAQIWREVLGLNQAGINDNFFESGGHSLKATLLISKVHQQFNVELPLKEIFRTPTIKALAQVIEHSKESFFQSIMPVKEKQYYQASSAQKRLYILEKLGMAGTSYNMPFVIIVEGELQRKQFETAINLLAVRHESLRTSLTMVENEIVQQISADTNIQIAYMEATEDAIEDIAAKFVRPFDLSQAPLFRAGLVKLHHHKHVLLFDMHHIISDGVSINILARDFMDLYQGKTLPELRIQYKDFSEWQNDLFTQPIFKKQAGFWLQQFQDEIPVLNLPTDYPRPFQQSVEGGTVNFEMEAEVAAKVMQLVNKSGATVYMVLLAAYYTLLYKYSGQEDIVIGSPIAGRSHVDLEQIIGMFINTLALRNYPTGTKTFNEFLDEVKKNALKAYENQDYQFETLVEKLNLRRDLSRNPLFDVMFVLQHMDRNIRVIQDLKFSPYELKNKTVKFDLTLTAAEGDARIYFNFDYCATLFKRETVARMAGHMQNILQTIVVNPDQRLADIEILSEAEKSNILYEFNDTCFEHPKDKTLQELFEEHAERTPENIAVVYEDQTLTYRQLNRKANQLAAMLRAKGVKSGGIVGIMVKRSLEMIIGVIGILKAGGAYLPIDPEYPADRILYMLRDSHTGLLLLQTGLTRPGDHFQGEVVVLDGNEELFDINEDNPTVINKSSDLAYVIYTSGSMGEPKGVLIEHRSIINTIHWRTSCYEFSENDAVLQMPSFAFDSSVEDIFTTLLAGAKLVLMRQDKRNDLEHITDLLQQHEISHFLMVPSFYKIVLREIKNDLPHLRSITIAGESFDETMVTEHFKRFPKVKLYNEYGPTENSVCTTFYQFDGQKNQVLIGKPINNIWCIIVNRDHKIQPIGVPGELCITGEGLSRGYLNQPELTAEKFIPNPFFTVDASHGTCVQRMYKTGDLAKWLPDGNIEFLGRIDHQVKIRGFRIELGEIEARIMQFEAVKEAVVVDKEDHNGNKCLCAYIVPTIPVGTRHAAYLQELRAHLMMKLPEYMIPSYFIYLEKMPLTPNGKIDRKALPEPDNQINTGAIYEAPRNEIERQLAAIWQEVLGLEQVGINDNFFELGGHSLKATILVSRIHKTINRELPLREVFQQPTIKKQAEYLQGITVNPYETIQPAIHQEEYPENCYPVSSAQKRLYILRQMEADPTSYNMPGAVIIEGIKPERLKEVFQKLIARHESLRTSFPLIEGEPMQCIQPAAEFQLEHWQAKETDINQIIQEFIRPFDLGQAPLLRVGLIEIEPGKKSILIYDMHHIVADGTSMGVIIDEFRDLYEGKELKPLRIQYKDYAQWQRDQIRNGFIKAQEEYWLKRFAGEIPVLNLPTDHPRPTVQDFAGDRLEFEIDVELTRGLKGMAAETGATLFMVLLAVYNVLLSKCSGQEDIVIGTPIAGRPHADLEQIIGMFVNTLALRNRPEGHKTFREFLGEVKEHALHAYEKQDYQFEELVEKLNPHRDINRNPIFDVMFILQNIDTKSHGLTGLGITPYPIESHVAKFDLTLVAAEGKEKLFFILEYSAQLYRRDTIEKMVQYFKNLLREITNNPDQPIRKIDMLSKDEKNEILTGIAMDEEDMSIEFKY